ncbi:MAG: oxygen-dependent coproporphyrinogen oxidase [Bacteroidota bacterium]
MITMHNSEHIIDFFKSLQDNICNALELADGLGKFQEDAWERPGGGGGRSRVILEGAVLEKGGVNFSAVHGHLPANIMRALGVHESAFLATGVSIVLHPRSPMVPIIHSNVRFFKLADGTCWFGGGIDLTPIYVDENDAVFFHTSLKSVCDRHDAGFYPRFKKWADDYFYIPHRRETRGIGGIFFDRMSPGEGNTQEELFAFVQDVGNAFAPVYTHIMQKTKDLAYGENEIRWQRLRRGRYAEFNLVYDKGTKFGLETDGRTESILMSLPPLAAWEYNHTPAEGSAEEYTISRLKKGIERV